MSEAKYVVKDLMDFRRLFKIVNLKYRQGRTEDEYIVVDEKLAGGEELSSFSDSDNATANPNAVSLRDIADSLYQFAERWWQDETGNDKKNPVENFQDILRSMTISFETDEKFLTLSDQKRKFFLEFNKFFIAEDHSSEEWINKIKDLGIQKNILRHDSNEAELLKLANELALFGLCGINVRLLTHSSDQYNKGLTEVERLDRCLEAISERKIKIADPEKHQELKQKQKQASGLKALNYFFKGRFHLGLGEFREAEKAFKKSRAIYFQNVNRLIFSDEPHEIESRSLSMRRANLVEVIGLVNLYYAESRIDEAFEILERVAPALCFNAGELMKSYCDLLRIRILRAKFSSDKKRLKELRRAANDCADVFKKYVPNSHFLEYIRIELSLIYFFTAERLGSEVSPKRKNSDKYKRKIYDQCLAMLGRAIEYGESPKKDHQPKNRRILIEAYNLRSHIFRNYAELTGEDFWETIEKAQLDSSQALNYAKDLKQFESEASYMAGAVYLAKYKRAARECDQTLKNRGLLDKKDSENKINDWSDAAQAYFDKAQEFFYQTLLLNTDKNPKVQAAGLLRLTESEILKKTNYTYANYFFRKFKETEHEVGHLFILEYAEVLRKQLERRENFDFYIDVEANKENLKFKYWEKQLERFLISQTIYLTALERKGELPIRAQRGKGNGVLPLEEKNQKRVETRARETQQSVLANAFISKMGMAPNKAYRESKKHLNQFVAWCDFVRDSKDNR